MVYRRGVGATIASSMVFSIILISNFAVFYASESRETSYTQANVEDSFYDQGVAIESAAGINSLTRLQYFISARSLICGSAVAEVGEVAEGTVEADSSGGLNSYMTARTVTSGSVTDNLTAVAPYSGALSGALDLALTFRLEGENSLGVSYHRNETHLVNLPVRIASAAGTCLAAVADIREALDGMVVENCTSDVIAPLVEAAERGPMLTALTAGFTLDVSYRIAGTAVCAVYFEATLIQSAVSGPAGPFNLVLQQGGFATFRRSLPQQQA